MSKEEFYEYIDDNPLNKFAKTFYSKANMMNLWPVLGLYEGNSLVCALSWSISKRKPISCNLQLLHTFATHRKRGFGRIIYQHLLDNLPKEVEYFRVSSEPESVGFYEKLGFQFWGEQKSKCKLSIAKVVHGKLVFNMDDYIHKNIHSKRKGGCVVVYEK